MDRCVSRALLAVGCLLYGSSATSSARFASAYPQVWRSLLLYTLVVGLLLLGGELRGVFGQGGALLLSFAAAAALTLAWGSSAQRRELMPDGFRLGSLLLSALAGVALLPALLLATRAVGRALPAMPPAPAPGTEIDVAALLSILVLGPLFEELLYRQQLLGALRAKLGAPAAAVLSSALFALPHLGPWFVLGTFLAGLILAALALAARSVWPSMGLHAGWNLAGLCYGPLSHSWPASSLPDPLWGVPLGLSALACAVYLARRRPEAAPLALASGCPQAREA